MTNTELARYIEHTLLRAEATPSDVEALCAEALENTLFGVCVPPVHVGGARRRLGASGVALVTVVGFPLGYSTPETKAEEARRAVADGANEIDMVLALGLARAGEWERVTDDVRAVRAACPGRILKVILETGLLSESEVRRAAECAVSAGAEFVKTSTGFGPRGASVRDVELLAEVVGDRARIKASGGIRTADEARALIAAGAARIGTSNGVDIARG
jgi:deoxyribose-phosphate aldolase